MARVIANDQPFERPFRFSGHVEDGVRFHQVCRRQAARVAHGKWYILRWWRENPPYVVVREAAHRPTGVRWTGAVREGFCRRVADVDVDEACRARIVESTGIRRAFAETQ